MVCLPDMKEYENEELKSRIFIEETAYYRLLSIVADNPYNLETGGIIIGHYDAECKNAVITEFTKPPADSKAGKFHFYRGVEGLKRTLQKCWKEQDEYYLGEWHLHPGTSPNPSYADIKQMQKIAKDKNFKCKEPILLILGEKINIQNICLMLFKDERIHYFSKRSAKSE